MQIARLARCQTIVMPVAMLHLVMSNAIITKFTNFFGNTVLRDGYHDKINMFPSAPSSAACIALCSMDNTCSLVNYNPESSTCVLMNWQAVSSVQVRRNHKYVENKIAVKGGRKQLYLSHPEIHYLFRFSEAEQLCKRVGGHLSTDEDVKLARDNGDWEVCGCGWITNGSAVYHVSVTSAGCGDLDYVCSVTSPHKYNVHCTVV